ncbi:MAG: hypothetical protein P4M15_05735 [Alphaproteobacteria bacterium]|nr:hypothetical protein [Alphaproteobacteria bacterium]
MPNLLKSRSMILEDAQAIFTYRRSQPTHPVSCKAFVTLEVNGELRQKDAPGENVAEALHAAMAEALEPEFTAAGLSTYPQPYYPKTESYIEMVTQVFNHFAEKLEPIPKHAPKKGTPAAGPNGPTG